MKHCFVINPAAGSGRDQEAFLGSVLEAVKAAGVETYELHRTSGPGEATLYVRDRLAQNAGETLRFYACGGDGTAAEVLNGLYGCPDAELAILPIGSGNDYIRNFGTQTQFLDVSRQLTGTAAPVDVIRYEYEKDGEGHTAYALNMVNIGFDAKVVGHMARLKNKIFLKGTGAYVAGVLWELARYKMSRAIFRPAAGTAAAAPFETDILLAGVGSGCFSGGGFCGIPDAVTNDGLLDLMVIEPISRLEFVRCVGAYHDGKHFSHPTLADKIRKMRLHEVRIEPVFGLVFSADGETLYTETPLTVSVAPEQIHFVVPHMT